MKQVGLSTPRCGFPCVCKNDRFHEFQICITCRVCSSYKSRKFHARAARLKIKISHLLVASKWKFKRSKIDWLLSLLLDYPRTRNYARKQILIFERSSRAALPLKGTTLLFRAVNQDQSVSNWRDGRRDSVARFRTQWRAMFARSGRFEFRRAH